MKRITFLLLFILFAGITVSGQTTKRTYEITNSGGISDLEVYYSALDNYDLDRHRLINQNRTIIFDSGVEIELFSVQKLESEFGRKRDNRFLNKTGNEKIYPWFWSLTGDGRILDKRIQKAITE